LILFIRWTSGAIGAPKNQMLPDYLQRKLNLAGGGLRGCDQTGARNRRSAIAKHVDIVRWRGKVCVIENVEEFCSELNVKGFWKQISQAFAVTPASFASRACGTPPCDPVVFKDRKVQL
jgi:hypothetical protein